MNIGELSEKTGITPSRIRFYERIGLLRAVGRKANGYRVYPAEAMTVLRLIDAAQLAGFSLEELRRLLPADLATWDHSALHASLHQKVVDIEAMQKQLAESKAHLLGVIKEIEAKPDDMDCAANARRVLANFGLN